MIALATICFVLLICAWFFGPTTEPKAVAEVTPSLVVGEAAA
jgi:hypothetical protein